MHVREKAQSKANKKRPSKKCFQKHKKQNILFFINEKIDKNKENTRNIRV